MKHILFFFAAILLIGNTQAQVSIPTVKIGNQVWMARNLDTDHYKNGDAIPQVSTEAEWIEAGKAGTGAWCYYNNDPANGNIYGKLYNWYAVIDPRGLAPEGWNIPNDADWYTLSAYLGGEALAGGAMKETGTTHWLNPITGVTNSSGFTGLPGGFRGFDGKFDNLTISGHWWSSSEAGKPTGWIRNLYNNEGNLSRIFGSKRSGFSVRCIKNLIAGTEKTQVNPPPKDIPVVIQKEEVIAETVTIGKQTWTQKNLNVDHYRNGDLIPEVKDSATWATLTTGAWCYFNNDPVTGNIYGKLYNWYAINDPRGLAPKGWHIPSDAEWTKLSIKFGGETLAGGAMKEKGTFHWENPNTGATNKSGFNGLPGGIRKYTGSFYGNTYSGDWWSATEDGMTIAWHRRLNYDDDNIGRTSIYKQNGLSVRCVRD